MADPYRCCIESVSKGTGCTVENKDCASQYCSSSGSACRSLFENKCVNDPTNDAQFNQAWTNDRFCQNMIGLNIRNRDGTINTDNLPWAQGQMKTVFSKEFSTGIKTPSPQFQSYLYDFCSTYPEACSVGLKNTCNRYNTQIASTNPQIANFCGCYLPEAEYQEYQSLYQLPIECDPLCARINSIPLTDSKTGRKLKCQNTVCVIDNVTIDLNKGSTGNINFSQVCNSCGASASCRCLISDIEIDVAEGSLGNINFRQQCGELECYTIIDGQNIPVDCQTGLPPLPPTSNSNIILYIIIGIGIILILAMVFIIIVIIILQTQSSTVNFTEPSGNQKNFRSL